MCARARALESALICADFYNSSKSKYIFTLITCIVITINTEYFQNVYENINLSFFENKKSSDSVLKFLIARLCGFEFWCVHSVAQNSKFNTYCCFFETFK